MNFVQAEFLVFFAVVLAGTWGLADLRRRNLWLLVASYYFYAHWDYRFCLLLAASTVCDHLIAGKISASSSRVWRRTLLTLSIGLNLSVLAYFKYANFFIESATSLLRGLNWDPSTVTVLLPIGISFFTFQTMSYTIDVYRGVVRPFDRWTDAALYVAFFPQLVAGPIVRASELKPQITRRSVWSRGRFAGGAKLMLVGAVKKVLIADRLSETVDVVFAAPELYDRGTVAIAIAAYTFQIYYDFSGYTDMAIGGAKMLGFRFPRNFDHPYLSTSIGEFWRRWHMTLSRWLRDYLYIPLGGNRRGVVRTSVNLMVTMALGGLWHGASWNFVGWGGGHGIALAASRLIDRLPLSLRMPDRVRAAAGWFCTMSIVVSGWVLFRCHNLDDVGVMGKRIMAADGGLAWYPPLTLLAIALAVFEHAIHASRWRLWLKPSHRNPATPLMVGLMVWALVLYAPRGFQPFVYFQF